MTPDIEVIGQILGQPSKLLECDLNPNDFRSTQYKTIYTELLDMQSEKIAIDPVSVAERLQAKTGQDWLTTLAELESKAFCYSTFQSQVDKVRRDGQIFQIQQKIDFCREEMSRNRDASYADKLIHELMQIRTPKNSHTHNLGQSVKSALDTVDKLSETEELPGLTTGIRELDNAIGGYHDTNLIVVGARPAMGKTAFLINTMLAAARNNSVGFISGEQGHEQLAMRMFSIDGGIDSQKLRTGKLKEDDWPKLTASVCRLKDLQVYINDEPGISINSVRRSARDWKYKFNIKALYVDYIQKIKPSKDYAQRREAVGEVVGALKDIARELKIPVIALAQVKREVDTRPGDKRPGMADLADSSEIEKEADEIITLYRDEVYNFDSPEKGIAELLVCKARHGRTGKVFTKWNGPLMRFQDLETRY